MGLFAQSAAARMQTERIYRTMSRMQRRSTIQGRLGTREDFEHEAPAKAETPAASGPKYLAELERLARLRNQGILSADEFAVKKMQILGILPEQTLNARSQ